MRDEPGLSVGAFVVELLPPPAEPEAEAQAQPGALSAGHIEQLRAAKRIIHERARAIFLLRTSMPPPQHGCGTAP